MTSNNPTNVSYIFYGSLLFQLPSNLNNFLPSINSTRMCVCMCVHRANIFFSNIFYMALILINVASIGLLFANLVACTSGCSAGGYTAFA